jgi:predicted HNH restriction endonuclease
MSRITEKELILPSLYLMEINKNIEITTPFLIKELGEILQPNIDDMASNPSRKDSRFSQKVRNLNSHDTLKEPNYAIYTKTGHNKGYYTITTKGQKYLNDNLDFLKYILNNNFTFNDKKEALKKIYQQKSKIEIFDEDIIIKEGKSILKTSKVYNRSSKLRNIAIEHFTKDNKIICEACCFDFEKFYGEHGKGFIEIHHQKPIFQFEEEETIQTIETALKNLMPVCSNCHRMIHRKKEYPLEIETIKQKINHSLSFCK